MLSRVIYKLGRRVVILWSGLKFIHTLSLYTGLKNPTICDPRDMLSSDLPSSSSTWCSFGRHLTTLYLCTFGREEVFYLEYHTAFPESITKYVKWITNYLWGRAVPVSRYLVFFDGRSAPPVSSQ